jgi:hypothetical protein
MSALTITLFLIATYLSYICPCSLGIFLSGFVTPGHLGFVLLAFAL